MSRLNLADVGSKLLKELEQARSDLRSGKLDRELAETYTRQHNATSRAMGETMRAYRYNDARQRNTAPIE